MWPKRFRRWRRWRERQRRPATQKKTTQKSNHRPHKNTKPNHRAHTKKNKRTAHKKAINPTPDPNPCPNPNLNRDVNPNPNLNRNAEAKTDVKAEVKNYLRSFHVRVLPLNTKVRPSSLYIWENNCRSYPRGEMLNIVFKPIKMSTAFDCIDFIGS